MNNEELQARTDESDESVDSVLCLACGLCCEGVLHDAAVLADEEDSMAAELRLTVLQRQTYRGFALPCHHHVDRRCTTYEYRPATCGRYECSLLKDVRSGTTSLPVALSIVKSARAQLDVIYQEIGGRDPNVRVWNQAGQYVRELTRLASGRRDSNGHPSESATPLDHVATSVIDEAPPGTSPRLLLALKVLAILAGRHFEPRNFSNHSRPMDGLASSE